MLPKATLFAKMNINKTVAVLKKYLVNGENKRIKEHVRIEKGSGKASWKR